jgi:uncharacterized protein (DUF169 family)
MTVQEALRLSKPPIAIGFLDAPPAGISKWDGPAVPAGCAFWRQAMEGKAFYTVAADHANCAVGSYTHGTVLPDLQGTVEFMIANRYIEMAEVPGIPALDQAPTCVAYAPLESAPFRPDVVLVAAKPGAAMLLYEAAVRAGASDGLAGILGRPGCAVLPLARKSGKAALSFGCKGNRTFTGLPEDELYFAVPGSQWEKVVSRLAEIEQANAGMEQYYRGRQQQFPIV